MQGFYEKYRDNNYSAVNTDNPSNSLRISSAKVGRNRDITALDKLSTEPSLATNPVSVSTSLKMQSPALSLDPTASNTVLLRQNQELRQRLLEETSSYRRRIDTYKQAQQNQATLVSRLQNKIQQYRQRCNDLEDRMQDTIKHSFTTNSPPKISTGPTANNQVVVGYGATANLVGQTSLPCSSSLESPPSPPHCERECLATHDDSNELCHKLEDEYNRRGQLLAQNSALRQQLEESNRTNEALTNDLQKLTNDWSILRDELMMKEDEYKEEEQAFKDYYNSEYNRLLHLWREVVNVKRTFKDVEIATKNELAKMGLEMQSANRDLPTTCNNVALALQQMKKLTDEELSQAKRFNDDLQAQLATLKVQHESARHEVAERDQRLQELMNQLKKLEGRCASAESQVALVNRYNDEIERLNAAIREIAHAVVQDAENTDNSNAQHITSQDSRTKSPHRGSATRTPQAFAEGTISAVQAALHKYQLAIHDMQAKMQNANEQLCNTKAQLKSSDDTKQLLTAKIQQLTEKLDMSNSKLSELFKERDSLHKTLEEIRLQKQQAEQGRAEINIALENLSMDFEKLQLTHGKLQKKIDILEDEKKSLSLEMQRILKDKHLLELTLRSEEDRCSHLREETISLREELNCLNLKSDLLEQQRTETENSYNVLEKQKSNLEFQLQKTILEKCDLQERLEKVNNYKSSASDELKSLQHNLTETHEERNKLTQHLTEQGNELEEIKRALSSAEKTRLELETDNMSLGEKIKCLQLEKEKILQDLACIKRDRGEIHNHLTALCRMKERLNEELIRTHARLEQTTETNNRLNRNLEEMVKNVEEKQVVIDSHEKEIHRLQEVLAALRSEKESLDAVLFDTNATLEATEEKRAQLERELQDALVREETFKNSAARLQKELEQCQRRAQETKTQLVQAARAAESNFNQQIKALKTAAEETAKKTTDDLLHLRNVLEKRMQQALQALQTAKDDEIEKLQERLEGLQGHLESVIQQHEEAMIRAENDKQQALLIAAHDKQAISEKLETVLRDLKAEQDDLERVKRENHTKEEKLRNMVAQLKDEIVNQRTKDEESRVKLEDTLRKQELQLNALKEERDNLLNLCDELKTEIRLKENKLDSLSIEHQEALRKIKEHEGIIESLRKELTENRRQLADSNIERDKYANSNKELRDHVRIVESTKREQARNLENALQNLSVLEENKNALENDRTRLSTMLKESENNLARSLQELNSTKNTLQKTQMEFAQKNEGSKDLQNKLTAEIDAKDRALNEVAQLKKQLADLEANLCATRQELGRARCHANQEETRFHNREEELVKRIEESRGREKRLEDQKHNLEVCLADATQQIQELKARLGGTESRIRALDEQLSCCEAHRRDTEQKLSSVVHTLRRVAGIQLDGTVNITNRLVSPSRRFSPVRSSVGHGSCHDYDTRSAASQGQDTMLIDVDTDLVRKGVRNLMHQVGHIEREKDDLKMQLATAKKQLHDAAEQQHRCDARLAKLQHIIRHMQEEKGNIENEKNIKVSALQHLEEQYKQKSNECQLLREKLAQIELQLSTNMEEGTQMEERLEKCRQHGNKLENEKHQLQDELSKIENRAGKLELQRVSLEGDLSRLQMTLKEKDCIIRQMQDRMDNQNRSLAQLEDRCSALKSTVDQLKDRLQKSTVTETELRGEIKTLGRELTEQGHCMQTAEEKMKLLQKSVQSTENEKKILSERLDSAQVQVNDLRRSQQAQLDSVQRLQEQVSELEVQRSALESQLRIAKWNQETNDKNAVGGGKHGAEEEEELNRKLSLVQRERNELRSKLNALQEKLRQYETTGRSKFSNDDNAYDRAEKSYHPQKNEKNDANRIENNGNLYKSASYSCGLDHATLEQESRDLRLKVSRLETMLAEKESQLARAKSRINDSSSSKCESDSERYRNAHMHAERVLDAREQAHKQQVVRLENQISILREQLAQEAKRRQQYILRSTKANREMQHLRNTLGDSLRHVAQHPLDPHLLESESRRLDSAVSMSLPPPSCRDYQHD